MVQIFMVNSIYTNLIGLYTFKISVGYTKLVSIPAQTTFGESPWRMQQLLPPLEERSSPGRF